MSAPSLGTLFLIAFALNVVGDFIRTEPLPWVWALERRFSWDSRHLTALTTSTQIHKFNLVLSALVAAVWIALGHITGGIVALLLAIYTASTALALLKLLNALLPPQIPIRSTAQILDFAIIFRGEDEGSSIPYILLQVEIPQFGVHVLPATPFNYLLKNQLRPGKAVFVDCKLGGLGLAYSWRKGGSHRPCWRPLPYGSLPSEPFDLH